MMTNFNRDRLFNILTYVVLVLTLCLVVYYALIGFGVQAINPFPYHTLIPPTALPTSTPPFPTWTPTPTVPRPTIGPTKTRTPTLTPSPIPTYIPKVTYTFPPTLSPTPLFTRAPLPFTCEVEYRTPEYGIWTGIAGHIEDHEGQPLPGYYVVVKGPGNPPALQAGADARLNSIYGSEAAWEQPFNPVAYQAIEATVQLCKPNPDPSKPCTAISNEVFIQLGGYASSSLGYVTCIKNWEEYE